MKDVRDSSQVKGALARLSPDLQRTLSEHFGLNGVSPQSNEETSSKNGVCIEGTEEELAEALRALMGYGTRTPGKEN